MHRRPATNLTRRREGVAVIRVGGDALVTIDVAAIPPAATAAPMAARR